MANEYAKKELKQGFDKCTKDGREMFDTFLSQADVAKLSKFMGKHPETGRAYVQTVTAPWLGGTCVCWMVAQGAELAELCEDSLGRNGSRAHGSVHDHMAACDCLCIKSYALDYMAAIGASWVAA